MGAECIPEVPDFADDSERVVWQALRSQLRDSDILMHGIRFTDPVEGDVEIDLLILMPDAGAIVIEVKGGLITFTDGQFHQSDGESTRPVNPLADRIAVLAGLAAVDYVVAFDSDTPAELIKAVQPDVLVKGDDYAGKEVVGRETVEARGGKVVLAPFLQGRSTTGTIGRMST